MDVSYLEPTPPAVAAEADEKLPVAAGSHKPLPRWLLALYRLLICLALLGIWQLLLTSGVVNAAFLPTPAKVLQSLSDLWANHLLSHVWETLSEALVGFGLGTVVGVLLGVTLGLLLRVNEVVAPFIAMANAAPRIALAPLLVLWFGIGSTSHVVLVFSLVVFIILTNTIAGTQSVDRDHLIVARLLGASRAQTVRKVVLPSTVPWIIAAMRLSWAYALAGAVVGEMFLGQNGLGYLISAGSGVFNIGQIFAALAITVTLAWVVDNLIRLAERRILHWRPSAMSGGA